MDRDRVVGGGFEAHAIPVYDVALEANAADDDGRDECDDREQPIIHERSVIKIKLAVCSLFDLRVYLK